MLFPCCKMKHWPSMILLKRKFFSTEVYSTFNSAIPFILEAKAAANDEEARTICKAIWSKLGRVVKDPKQIVKIAEGKSEVSEERNDEVFSTTPATKNERKPQKKESKQEKKKKKQQAKSAASQPSHEESTKNATSGFLSSRDNARVEDVALTKGQT